MRDAPIGQHAAAGVVCFAAGLFALSINTWRSWRYPGYLAACRQSRRFEYFAPTHPGAIALRGDTADRRTYLSELMHGRKLQPHHGICHDRYERTPNAWKFAERVYEPRYADGFPPAGSAFGD
jgi:hypothetical protein